MSRLRIACVMDGVSVYTTERFSLTQKEISSVCCGTGMQDTALACVFLCKSDTMAPDDMESLA